MKSDIRRFRGKREDLVLIQYFKYLKTNWHRANVTVCSCRSQWVLTTKHRITRQKKWVLQFIKSLFSSWPINWLSAIPWSSPNCKLKHGYFKRCSWLSCLIIRILDYLYYVDLLRSWEKGVASYKQFTCGDSLTYCNWTTSDFVFLFLFATELIFFRARQY